MRKERQVAQGEKPTVRRSSPTRDTDRWIADGTSVTIDRKRRPPTPRSDDISGRQRWSLRLEMLLDAFLSGRSEQTIRAYRGDLDDFRRFVQCETLVAAARVLLSEGQGEANALVSGYKSALIAHGLSASTINRRLAALRSLVKVARTFGLVRWTLDVESVKAERYRDTRGPGRAGVLRLLSLLADRRDSLSIRNRAIVRLLYDLALRRGEVVGLDVADFDAKRRTLAVRGKGRTDKTLLNLPRPTHTALRQWLAVRGSEPGPLFVNFDRAAKGGRRLSGTSLYRTIRQLGAAAGITVTPHGLRHTAITEACKVAQAKGIDLEEVLDFSRHTDVKVLMVYRDRERDVQGLLAKLVADEV